MVTSLMSSATYRSCPVTVLANGLLDFKRTSMNAREQAAFELWKRKETQRVQSQQRQEMGVLFDKIKKQWAGQQLKVMKDWEESEGRVLEGFEKIETAASELRNVTSEKQGLERQLKSLEQENNQMKQVPADTNRDSRLVRINNLRLEIQQLESDLTSNDAKLRVANESKNRYKRLFLESTRVVQELVEEDKRHRRK